MVRPIVLVFQEFAELTVTPSTPDLNCLVLGPAYQILDYPEDKDTIQVSDYGTLNADNPYIPPVAFTAAITLAGPPGIGAGGLLDPDSVEVFFDEARVILDSGTDGDTTIDDNLLTSAAATFVTDGIQPGDVLIIDNPPGPATPNLILTISSVESETTLRVTTNFSATVGGTLAWRIERELADQLIDSSFVVTQPFGTSNEIEILGGVTLTVDNISRVVAFGLVYVEYRAFRTDLQTLDSVASTQEILSKLGPVDSRNPLAVGVSVARQNSGQAPIQFYGVASQDLIGYNLAKDAVSSDESVYAMVPLIVDTSVIASYKADNEILADPNLALASGVPQKFRVVLGSGELPITEDISPEVVTGTTEQLTGAIPVGTRTLTLASLTALTTNLAPGDVITLSASENIATLDGAFTLAHINSETEVEVDEALAAVVGVAEGINYVITRPSTGATIVALVDNRSALTVADVVYTSRVAGATPGVRTIELVQDGTTPSGINSIIEVAGVSTVINADWAGGAPDILASNVVAALNTGAGVTVTFTGSVNIVASTAVPGTVQAAAASAALSSGTPGVDDLTSTAALDEAFLRLFDSASTFITDGVLPGDIIEMPETPNGVFATNIKRFTVDQILSEQRLQILNLVSGSFQNNSSILENELPHTDARLGDGTTVTQTSIRYRVLRDLSKDQQVSNLVSVAQSINSRRAILSWPDSVEVAGLVDNSQPKNTDGTAAAADPQPGYFGACAIGGMTAGLPSHQGFSRLGIAGISELFNSNTHFTEQQITDLSDGGWYVFAQNTPASLPFSVHQLTTDPSTLESGEYSLVKNFDFVSLFFVDILEPFLGIWNVNNDTLGFIRQAVNTGIENLKLRRVARIGAPINDATITSLGVSEASADRVEIFVEVDFPVPLNVIGLHLVG